MLFHSAKEMILAVLLLLLQINSADAALVGLPGCLTTCGNITIPFLFGIGKGCYFEGFNLTCNFASRPPKLFFGDGTIEVIEIYLTESIMRLRSTLLTALPTEEKELVIGLPPQPSFALVLNQSVLTAVGCNIITNILGDDGPVAACTPLCPVNKTGHTCSGIVCSQASARVQIGGPFTIRISPLKLNGSNSFYDAITNTALLVEQEWLDKNVIELIKFLDPFSNHQQRESMVVPFVLDWSITHDGIKGCLAAKENVSVYQCLSANHVCSDALFNGYRCKCKTGYEGNAYLTNGCEDIDECQHPDIYPCNGICINFPGTYQCKCPKGKHRNAVAGRCISNWTTRASFLIGVATTVSIALLILALTVLLCKLKKINEKLLRKKHFLQNRGLLLQQLLCFNEDVAGRMKIFSIEELDLATNKFDQTRLLGRGGHGEVSKGILSDKRVVAIKKSRIIVKREIDQFINEVAILSQIKHRNVVRLFGCCLETEVPLLVYEFISNGTLCDHLHAESKCCLSWDDRLRIALETARALSYLHTAAPVPVFHRDIKSSNIMLDETLAAKVSDFGASRSVSIDQTRITTAVQGTYGYLDPEYYYTSRLTNRSDDYSFGVILVELLTRETPHAFSRSEEGTLVSYFSSLQRENRVVEMLDPQILQQGWIAQLKGVAELAEVCLRLKGEERPTMKEVEMRLEELMLQKRHVHPWTAGSSGEQQRLLQLEGGTTTRQYSFEQEIENSSSFPR
ncbi:Wall-associated kinase family protein [Rhynchospora pubera]|uniref:Wall-associated kinase family protein n=1 Tax=Rhynchospora pubera TaxID=906938 RepID=A0AAV8G1E1_9POAL|nr:Wall-associated kinase family protein [Rhynchospora pubera]